MSENIGRAKPALAAHSKEGSAPGQTSASEARPQPKQASQFGAVEETINQMASEVCGFVQQQPFTAAALMGGIGLLIGLLLGRRWE
jgi:ElaB/YqjD/DUF883 family membrane-anchored ribosome-binding protein